MKSVEMTCIRIGVFPAMLFLISSCDGSREEVDTDVSPKSETIINSSHARVVELNGAGASDEELGVELVEASKDHASIRAISSGRVLKAAIGGYFSSEEFGRIGLQLIETDPETSSVKLLRRWSETRTVTTP